MSNGSSAQASAKVHVWDCFVRVFHWALVIAFTTAYFLSEDETLTFHTWAGYTVASLVLVRIAWGFVGPRHARFVDFVYRPWKALAYLKDLILFRADRYLGHSPAGGLMVVALLASLLLTAGSGMAYYGTRNETDAAASYVSRNLFGFKPTIASRLRDTGNQDIKEIHELFGNINLILIFAHIGGVVLASFAHRENLVRAMVTGAKRR